MYKHNMNIHVDYTNIRNAYIHMHACIIMMDQGFVERVGNHMKFLVASLHHIVTMVKAKKMEKQL